MAGYINDLEKEVFALPREDRSRIALDLIRSLDKDDESLLREEWEAAWVEEANRRLEEIERGEVALLSHEEVMAVLRSALKNQDIFVRV
ncbi:MAG: addiction module protein [Thiohalophilus sp.]|uniref:addiction module protein n=1 Tax=Thiohalophilus sp. TaxID=3028392 RepID=UPI0028705B45|nr:addiction module protein [Thiohalophilus sp.]MDR9435363.1 addiction module protein [Thiohalophilus sp.]